MDLEAKYIKSSQLKLGFNILLLCFSMLNSPIEVRANATDLKNMNCNAGRDTTVFVCIDTEIIDVSQYLSTDADTNGFWINGENTFDPITFNFKTFEYVVDDGVCDPDTAFIRLNRRQAAGLATFINRVCFGDSVFFNGAWYLEPGFYDDTIKYINTQCDSVIDRLALFNNPAPTFQLIDTVLCGEDSIFFAGQWQTQAAMIDTTLQYSESSCDSLIGTLNLSFVPVTDFSISGIDTICQDESIILSASPATSTYLWSTGSTELTAEINQGGTYSITATDINSCDVIKTIEVPSYPVTTLSGTDVYFVTMDTLLTLDIASNNQITSTIWSSDEVDIDCINCLNPQIFVTDTTNIDLIAIDQNGCQASFKILVVYKKEPVDPVLYIPTVFNPKSDQSQNQKFYVQSDEPIPYSMRIYDRWGNLIYYNEQLISNDSSQSWNGTFRGKALDNGVYLYQVVVDDIVKVGTVTILR